MNYIHVTTVIPKRVAALMVFMIVAFGTILIHPHTALADSFNAGRIIDDAVFTNSGSMNATQIQNFLNSKVSSCDTNGTQTASEFGSSLTHAQYAASKGWSSPPYTCLKNYTENGQSSSQIIYTISQQYQINPQVLIVLLQKEQGLVTDTWPLASQYKTATGYGCPDTAACDTQYYGFTNQVTWAAKMFRAIMNNSSTWYTPYILGNNYIQYNPSASCGGSTVNIQNRATQALYNYTPYQPNAAAIAAPMGSTVTCGAYGNLNFYRYFASWFGSTTGPDYAWQLNSATLYYDSGMTQQVAKTNGVWSLKPGQTAYVKVATSNIGRTTWPKTSTHLGTQASQDRSSLFANNSWLTTARTGGYNESGDIAPNGTATFTYSITAPQTTGTYSEGFGVVVEGVSWASPATIAYTVSVPATEITAHLNSNYTMTSGATLTPGQNLLSTEGHSVLHLSFGGSLELWTNYQKVWSSNTDGSGANRFVNQSDGNLVLYKNNTAVWTSGTYTPGTVGTLTLQSDGNLVLYKNGSAAWASNTGTWDQYGLTNSSVTSGQMLFPGQSLYTSNRYYRLTAQTDGNIVLYTPTRAIWASNTYKRLWDHLIVQGDGNIVAYDGNNYPVWTSNTFMSGGVTLSLQDDGNTVFYAPGRAVWATNTFMVR